MTVADLERYSIRRLCWNYQAVRQLRPKLPRWLRRLREEYRFRSVPRYPYDGWPIHRVALFDNLMNLWAKQEAQNDPKRAHDLRNLIGLPGRPYKVPRFGGLPNAPHHGAHRCRWRVKGRAAATRRKQDAC